MDGTILTMAIFTLRTTANREDQVFDFLSTNAIKKKLPVFAIVRPHGLRGYIFVEAENKQAVEESYHGVPYARGILGAPIEYKEIEPMLEQAKVTRVDHGKEEVVVELLEAAVPIPITVKLDSVKVIRRDTGEEEKKDEE